MDIASVRAAYRRYAKIYDLAFGGVFAFGRRRALSLANRRGGQRVLEVGVGTGLSLSGHRADNRVVGIDISPEMLAIARRRVDRQHLRHVEALLEMDAGDLDFPDNSFDVVVAMFVMTVVPDPKQVMSELKRVCKPGGHIYLVNHFASETPGPLRGVELVLARFSKQIGWRPDVTVDSLLDAAQIQVSAIHKIHPLGLFRLLECRNSTPGHPPAPQEALAATPQPAQATPWKG